MALSVRDPTPETLIPLINVWRKISACNQSQKAHVMQLIPTIFSRHSASSVLMDVFLYGLCRCHSMIPPQIFADIESLLPSESEVSIDDTIAQCKDDSVTAPTTLIRMPSDLIVFTLNFLDLKDAVKVQSTCRMMCRVGRNPNVFQLLIVEDEDSTHLMADCYSNPRTLSVYRGSRRDRPQMMLNSKWGTTTTRLHLSMFWEPNQFANGAAISFRKLKQCALMNSDIRVLLRDHINSQQTLEELDIRSVTLDHEGLLKLCQFVNLKHLSLGKIMFDPQGNGGISSSDFKDKKAFYVFEELCIDQTAENFAPFVHWMLGSDQRKKTLRLNVHEMAGVHSLFSPSDEEALTAFRSIKALHIDLWRYRNAGNPLIANMLEVLDLQRESNEMKMESITITVHKPFVDPDGFLSLSQTSCFGDHAEQFTLSLSHYIAIDRVDDSKMGDFIERFRRFNMESERSAFTALEIKLHLPVEGLTEDTGGYVTDPLLPRGQPSVDWMAFADQYTARVVAKIDEWIKPWLEGDGAILKEIGLVRFEAEFSTDLSTALVDQPGLEDQVRGLEVNGKRVDSVYGFCGQYLFRRIEDAVRHCFATNDNRHVTLKVECRGFYFSFTVSQTCF